MEVKPSLSYIESCMCFKLQMNGKLGIDLFLVIIFFSIGLISIVSDFGVNYLFFDIEFCMVHAHAVIVSDKYVI